MGHLLRITAYYQRQTNKKMPILISLLAKLTVLSEYTPEDRDIDQKVYNS